MELTREMIRSWFSDRDYHRGMDYQQKGHVKEFEYSGGEEQFNVHCVVEGAMDYDVSFCLMPTAMTGFCTCSRFAQRHTCKHIAAALLQLEEETGKSRREPRSDRRAKRLLSAYTSRVQEERETHEGQVRLVPRLSLDIFHGYPDLTFQVGYDRLYVVKDVREFLYRIQRQETFSYGKKLTLRHALSEFDQWSRKLIDLLMDEFRAFRTFEHRYSYMYDQSPRYGNKNIIKLEGSAFDRFFTLVQELQAAGEGQSIGLEFADEDPQIRAVLRREKNSAVLELPGADKLQFFGNPRTLYAVQGERLLRCSDTFRRQAYPLVEDGVSEMVLALRDLSAFCSVVLPEIQGQVEMEDSEGLLTEYLPDEMTPRFYLDMEDEVLSARLVFAYAEQEAAEWDQKNLPGVKRDVRREQQARLLLSKWFEYDEYRRLFVIHEEEKIYDFLIDSLPDLQQAGEVFLSDRLQSRQLNPTKASVGISVSEGSLELDFDTGEFPPEELEALYQSLLVRRKYHKLKNGQFLPLNGSAVEKLAEAAHMTQLTPRELESGKVTLPVYRGLYLDSVLNGQEGLKVTRDKQFRAMIRSFKTVSESDYTVPEGLEGVLRPYQKTGFRWLKTLESCGFGGILADEMGLGKTVQVISFLATATRTVVNKPSLIVCPSSLILNWGDEFARFAPELKLTLLMGTGKERKTLLEYAMEQSDVIVTSYDLLKRDIKEYEQQSFYCCVLDEGQFVKNQSTLASKSVKRINARQRFVLTGTPIENRLSELWNLFDFLMPGYLFSHHRFVEKLEKPIVKSRDQEAGEQLRKLVRPFLLRRLKQDVLKELPPKVEHIRRVSLSQEERKTYMASVAAARSGLGNQSKLQILAALTRLRQICCDPNLCFENYKGGTSKLDACVELCTGMVENGHQILLFSQFTSMLDQIRKRLEAAHISSFTLQGSTPKEQRARLVRDFNAGGAQVFLISLKAGGTGLNLTAADVVIHYDPWWNIAAQNQATDRAHRIGQRSCVQVYKLIAKDSIEEKILNLQEKKAELMNAVSDGSEQSILGMSKEDLLSLLD